MLFTWRNPSLNFHAKTKQIIFTFLLTSKIGNKNSKKGKIKWQNSSQEVLCLTHEVLRLYLFYAFWCVSVDPLFNSNIVILESVVRLNISISGDACCSYAFLHKCTSYQQHLYIQQQYYQQALLLMKEIGSATL